MLPIVFVVTSLLVGSSSSLLLPSALGRQLGDFDVKALNVSFPDKCQHQDAVKPLMKNLDKKRMKSRLEKLCSFPSRFYRTMDGQRAAESVFSMANDIVNSTFPRSEQTHLKRTIPGPRTAYCTRGRLTIEAIFYNISGKPRIGVAKLRHEWLQPSVMAIIEGQDIRSIVLGAHLDSINQENPDNKKAPGADDDGSGVVTNMEVFQALLQDKTIAKGLARNTIQFHWYSAEEVGLNGSDAIFNVFRENGVDVKAMLQQDMTGYIKGTLDAGKKESIAVNTDRFVDAGLTQFVKTAVEEYCTIPWVETQCNYTCSDHSSATKYGYPSAFVIEAAFNLTNPYIHTAKDVIKHLSFDHMLQHARMALGFAYELAFHDFGKDDGSRPGKYGMMGELFKGIN
ncbi:leucyl aminopeptidase [Ophiocordyceps camponoti-floridani]|uniref:Peptide hydrolase n=1 Tax=Ophiocordyceps camponoti-floridani TaxID=2030778 RepID=A0A8H4QB77_9HYPO|nr:leucyl aminopeptidase [Ophiocordyceps camponoti-floridani]